MPIRLPQYAPRLAESGRIKNGINVFVRDRDGAIANDDNGRPKTRPTQLDHFLITTNQRDPKTGNFEVDQRVMNELRKIEGLADEQGKIRRIPIVLHSDSIDSVFATRLAHYQGRAARCSGDGERAREYKIERGARVGEPRDVECPCHFLEEDKCKGHAILRCAIALPSAVTLGSVYTYRTTSKIGIPNMLGGLAHIQQEIGTLVGIPLWLELRSELVNPDGQAQKTVHSAFIHLRGADIVELQRHAIARAQVVRDVHAVAGRHELLGLPAPGDDDEDDDEQASTSAEFHPEPVAGRDYDPRTGEVIHTTARDVPPKESTAKPASQLKRGDVGYADKPADKTEKPSDKRERSLDDPLPLDDSRMGLIASALAKIAELKGIQDPARVIEVRKEYLAICTKAIFGKPVLYKQITGNQVKKISDWLAIEIGRLEAKLPDERNEREPGEDDDEIP